MDIYHKPCGLPPGTGLIRKYDEAENIGLPADAKTIRKAINFQRIPKRKSVELEKFISNMLGGLNLHELVPKEDILLVQAQWWAAVHGARIQSDTPDTTYYVSKVLLQVEARTDVFDYIEMYYNPNRRHGNNGGISSAEYEKQHFEKL